MKRWLSVAALWAVCLPTLRGIPLLGEPKAAENARLLTVIDFETGDLSQGKMQKAGEDSIVVVTAPVRSGKFAARTLLRANDEKVSKGQRAEFSDGKDRTKILMDADYWYGLSLFVPDDFKVPAKSSAVLMQWHTQIGGPSPVLAIRVVGDEWQITCATTTEKSQQLSTLR